MSIFTDFFSGKRKQETTAPERDNSYARGVMPSVGYQPYTSPQGTRSSIPTSSGGYISAGNERKLVVQARFNFADLTTLEQIALEDSDVSYAVHNFVTLANTEYSVSFDESVSKSKISKLHEEVRTFDKIFNGGIHSLRQGLFTQLAVYGAMSYELILSPDLSELVGVVLVNPTSIRFYYDTKSCTYKPLQIPVGLMGPVKLKDGAYVELRESTYRYTPLMFVNDNPYGIPPFLSAIEPASLDVIMRSQYRKTISRFNIFGMLMAYMKPIEANHGETPEAHQIRRQALVTAFGDVLSKSVDTGILAGELNNHKFEFASIANSGQEAANLQNLNTTNKASGLKSPEILIGRGQGGTEVAIRVLMSKETASLAQPQRLVDGAVAEIIKTALVLRGNNVKYVMVESGPPVIGDEVRDYQARQSKMEVAQGLYDYGTIDKDQMAQYMGYDKASSEPRIDLKKSVVGGGGVNGKPKALGRDTLPDHQTKTNQDPTAPKTTGSGKARNS